MFPTNRKFNKLFLAALVLAFVEALNRPKVDAKTIENTTQLPLPASSVIATPPWKEFSSSEGKFSVFFPDENVFDMTPLKESFVPGIQSFKMYATSDKKSKSAFIVGYGDLSIDISQLSIDELLDAFLEGILQRKSKLLSQTNIQLEQYQGKEAKVRLEEQKMTYNTRFFLVGQKIYFMMVANRETSKISDTQKFFNSFQLIK